MFGHFCVLSRDRSTGVTDPGGLPVVEPMVVRDDLPCAWPQERVRLQDEEPDAEIVTERLTMRVPTGSNVLIGDSITRVYLPDGTDAAFGELEVIRATPRRTHLEVLCRRAEAE